MTETFNLDKWQIDRLLRIEARLCSRMGCDSTDEEKLAHKEKLKRLDNLIETVDPDFYQFIKDDE